MYQDLSDLQILEFAIGWYEKHTSNSLDCDRKKKRFCEHWQRKVIQELIGNSTLLEMFVKLNNYEEPPATRNELYKEWLEFLLNEWDLAVPTLCEHLYLLHSDKREILAEAAAHIHELKSIDRIARHLISESDLTKIVLEQLQRKGVDDSYVAQQIIGQMKLRDNVLYEAGEGYFGFAHQRFFEYCLAQYFMYRFWKWDLTMDDICQVFVNHVDNDRWHGMLTLLAGAIDISFVPKIIDTLLYLDGGGRKYRNVFLAARCVIERKWWNEISESVSVLQSILQNLTSNPEFRLEALELLTEIERHRLQVKF